MCKKELTLSGDKIILEHGDIEVVLGEAGRDYMRYSVLEYHVNYERKDYYLYENGESDSLDGAMSIYEELHKKAESRIKSGTVERKNENPN